jgi:hypothetical protein
VGTFSPARFQQESCEVLAIARVKVPLGEATQPRSAVGKQKLLSTDGEKLSIEPVIMFPAARSGKPRTLRKALRRKAHRSGTDGEVDDGPAKEVRCPTSAVIPRDLAKWSFGGEIGGQKTSRRRSSSIRADWIQQASDNAIIATLTCGPGKLQAQQQVDNSNGGTSVIGRYDKEQGGTPEGGDPHNSARKHKPT